jgi:hypothetical protein
MIKEKQETIEIEVCDLCGEEIDDIMDGYEGSPAILIKKKFKHQPRFHIHHKCLDDLILKYISEKK